MFFSDFFNPLILAFKFAIAVWWIFVPVILAGAALETYQTYTRKKFLKSLKWVLLEIKPPTDLERSAKIAENIFSGLHGVFLPVSWKSRFFQGRVQTWFSMEIVGSIQGMRFYVRTPESFRNLVEGQIFAQYPTAEISVADDYVENLPKYLPDEEYDLFGAELEFTKENAYPIRTYSEFEDPNAAPEFKVIDTLAPLAEVIGTLEPGENIWLQFIIRPAGGDWVKQGQKVVDKILKKEAPPQPSIFLTIDSLIFGGTTEEKKKEGLKPSDLSFGEQNVLKSVQNKLSRLAFESSIRFLYVGRRSSFHLAHVSAVTGMFKQLYANDMNSFKPEVTSGKGWFKWLFPSDKGFFAAWEEFNKKWHMYQHYRDRAFAKKVVILNVEELATLYHLPGPVVMAPSVPRVEARKGQPPNRLPIQG